MSKYKTLYERLVANIRKELVTNEQACWIWARKKNYKGYPKLNIWRGGMIVTRYAHRTMYELTHGDIPCGFEIDHTCENPSCINPDHLQAVPGKINNSYRFK